MFCRTCGKENFDQTIVCFGCGCPPLDGSIFCQECGADTNPKAIVCIKCGVAVGNGLKALTPADVNERITASNPPKDPVLMGILSGCLFTGLGQMILGQTAKGVAMLLGSFALGVVSVGASLIITIPAGGIDAYLIAKKLKSGKTVGQWEFF